MTTETHKQHALRVCTELLTAIRRLRNAVESAPLDPSDDGLDALWQSWCYTLGTRPAEIQRMAEQIEGLTADYARGMRLHAEPAGLYRLVCESEDHGFWPITEQLVAQQEVSQ